MTSPWAWQPTAPPFLSSLPSPSALPPTSASNSTPLLLEDHTAAKERTYSRPFWGGELAFAIGTLVNPGYSDMLLSCQIHLPSNPSERPKQLTFHDIQRAARLLRFHHPAIAATISFPPFVSLETFDPSQGRVVYTSPSSEKDVQSWLSQITKDKSDYVLLSEGNIDQALQKLKREIGFASYPRDRWMFKLFFLSNPEKEEYALLLHTGHTVFDGIGTFEVLDLFLHQLAAVLKSPSSHSNLEEHHAGWEPCAWGEESERLARAVPDRLDEPWKPHPPTPSDHPVLKAMAESLKMPAVQFGLPLLHPVCPPTTTGNMLLSYPPPMADNLRLAARAHGVGVFSLIVAANYLSLLELGPPRPSWPGWAIGDGEQAGEELQARILPNASDLRGKYLRGGTASKKDRSTWEVASALGGGVISARHLERFLPSLESNPVVSGPTDQPEEGRADLDEKILKDVWVLARDLQEQVTWQAPFQATAGQWVPDAITLMMNAFFTQDPGWATERKVVNVSSMGLMDDSLAPFYPFATSSGSNAEPALTVTHPIFTGIGPSVPANELGALVHPYTWQGTLFLSFSFPEAFMGSVEEQKERASRGQPTLSGYVERFGKVLERLARAEMLPN